MARQILEEVQSIISEIRLVDDAMAIHQVLEAEVAATINHVPDRK